MCARGEADGDVGAQAGGDVGPLDCGAGGGVGALDGADDSGGVGRASANAGGDGQVLFEIDGAEGQVRCGLRDAGEGDADEVLTGDGAAEGAGGGDALILPGSKGDDVREVLGEGDQAVEFVVAIVGTAGAAAEHAQGQVDLRGRAFDDGLHEG